MVVSLVMGYDFKKIFQVSETKDLKKLPEEFQFVGKERRDDGLCICGANIKKVEYYLNIRTGYIIQAGSECRKKLRLTLEGSKLNPILRQFLEGFKVEYTNIFDLLRYCEESQKRMMDLLVNRITICSGIATLQILLKELEELLGLHRQNNIHCEYINELIKKVNVKIQSIEKVKKQQKEQMEQREKEQREQREKEQREKREKWEKEEKERIEKWGKWEKEEKERIEKWEKEQREKEIERKERKTKWENDKKEMERKFMIEKQEKEREEDIEKEENVKAVIDNSENMLEIQEKKPIDFWARYYTKPSNPSPKEP